MLTFLHLSDLHFVTAGAGTQYELDDEIRAALLDDLGKEGRSHFDAILVTGDVAYHGLAEEFERASEWFAEVRKITGVPDEFLFTVPGNHDVNQCHVQKGSIMWDAHQSLRQINDEAERDGDLQGKLTDSSWDFLLPLREYRDFAAQHGRLGTTSAQELAWACRLTSVLDDGTPVVLHGLNSAFLSDSGDMKANLLVSPFQFRSLRVKQDCVNLVMCHHPSTWLIDGNHVEDRLRKHAHVVLTGHEHQSRCFSVGDGLRVCAGAVHPSRGEREWNPGYNVIRLSVEHGAARSLLTEVEARVWHKTRFIFCNSPYSNASKCFQHRQSLPALGIATASDLGEGPPKLLSRLSPMTVTESPEPAQDAAFAAARRKLIIHFFRLGPIGRYEAVKAAGVWEDSDARFEGQTLWARVFDRATVGNKLASLWEAVATEDKTLIGQSNPFWTQP